ncbi:AAA family ATPase [Nocardia brasiliensis]|uniref:AAA family ATPase n=1 Tax=Nocardia brasiliensis TaxID=37326 RepID=UPI0004A76901|nr:AAA family ATPase [Nocardia brasiliensis]
MSLPTLVVVSGPPGVGKTTLAHGLARRLGCPAVCRDEIKEGMVHATPGFVAGVDNSLDLRTLSVFFETLELLVRAGVTTVAEAAFQDRLWRPGLTPLLGLAQVRVVHCVAAPEVAAERIRQRRNENRLRRAHSAPGSAVPVGRPFDRVALDVPCLEVDTAAGYDPSLDEVLAFVNR